MARSLWSDRPLGVKLAALVAVGALALTAFAVIAVGALAGAGARTQQLQGTTTATGLALEADMMHDAVRADVLSALLAGRGAGYTAAVGDLGEHGTHLRETLHQVGATGLGDDVATAVAQVGPAVDAYLAAADAITRQAGADPTAARAAYPAFLQQFSALEEQLPTVTDAVARHAAAASAASAEQRGRATVLLVAVAVGGVLLLGGLGRLVTRSVVGPLRRVAAVVAGLADGDLTGTTGVHSRDEVGRIAAAVEGSMADLRSLVAVVTESATTLAAATEQLSATASGVADLADRSADRTGVVAAAAEQVSGNVALVAQGSAELGESIRSIARSAGDVAAVAGEAVALAGSATDAVAQLGGSSRAIAGVVAVITSIAEQTNLLALNATIEAARAGEAGKGFAVVATEVKELAQETARATQDITARVEGIQADTEAAVAAIGEIAAVITRIDGAQGSIAAAVEEQTALTAETGRHVAEAATGAGSIAATIGDVAATAGTTTRAMADAQQAIGEVARRAAELQTSLGRFRC